jgi:hypothetical protein
VLRRGSHPWWRRLACAVSVGDGRGGVTGGRMPIAVDRSAAPIAVAASLPQPSPDGRR